MDFTRIGYPQYWLQVDNEATFLWHLEILKNFYWNPCPCGEMKEWKSTHMVFAIVFSWNLDAQQGLFKLIMKSNAFQSVVEVMVFAFNKANPIVINHLTHMWWLIDASQLLSHVFPKYLKVTNIVMVHVIGFVKDKRCFNSIAFLRNKVCNHLNNHLQLIVDICAQ